MLTKSKINCVGWGEEASHKRTNVLMHLRDDDADDDDDADNDDDDNDDDHDHDDDEKEAAVEGGEVTSFWRDGASWTNSPPPASCKACHTSHVPRHTSHVTHHTSHVTLM